MGNLCCWTFKLVYCSDEYIVLESRINGNRRLILRSRIKEINHDSIIISDKVFGLYQFKLSPRDINQIKEHII
jgi:hypothetical protein